MNQLNAPKHLAIVLLCAVTICGGCGSTTQVRTGRHDQFRNALVETCHLIRMSEFERAQERLDDSRSLAMNDRQVEKVDDLQRVLQGSRAMDSGDPSSASDAWLAIRDVKLKQQFVDLSIEKGINLKALADSGITERGMKP
ncbi:MAG: hypothetical protein CMJ40_09235 [Phycisphaerae bacterium]|nr:hypothetical protein [Phycisphaerae bacterium]|tara:strand:+ start:590 stop:1012 length:423 start_codon:yes stop_codon:yes gene_type:complete